MSAARRRLAIVGLLLSGCMSLGPRPDSSKFFTLTPLAGDGRGGAAAEEASARVGLGPIVLPAYLDRTELVRRVGANEVRLAASDRWAEPLPDAVARVLQQNLTLLLGSERVVVYPWPPGTRIDTRVDLEVLRFEPGTDGGADLTARWTVRDATGARPQVARESHVTEPASGGDTAAAVAAMSRALGMLSSEIAAGVRDRDPPSGSR